MSGYQESIKTYQPYVNPGEERQLTDRITAAFAQYLDVSERANAMLTAGKNGDALDLLTSDPTRAAFKAASDAASEDVQFNVGEGTDDSAHSVVESSRATWINLGATLLIVVLCALVGIGLNRIIAPRIVHVMDTLQQLAAKDLTVHIPPTGTDEIGKMANALNTCVESIRNVVQSVAEALKLSPRRPPRSARVRCRARAMRMRNRTKPTRLPRRRKR